MAAFRPSQMLFISTDVVDSMTCAMESWPELGMELATPVNLTPVQRSGTVLSDQWDSALRHNPLSVRTDALPDASDPSNIFNRRAT